MSRPAPDSTEIRTHRPTYPNRRPLLVSAFLVALTSIPTTIVVVAGSASLDDGPSSRPPVVAEAPPGPVVVNPGGPSGPGGVGGLEARPHTERQSVAAEPYPPAATATRRVQSPPRRPGAPGGGHSGGTGGGGPLAPLPADPTPERQCPTEVPEIPADGAGDADPTTKPSPVPPTGADEPDPGPVPSRVPPTGAPGGTGIEDRAWPDWDSKHRRLPEASRTPAE